MGFWLAIGLRRRGFGCAVGAQNSGHGRTPAGPPSSFWKGVSLGVFFCEAGGDVSRAEGVAWRSANESPAGLFCLAGGWPNPGALRARDCHGFGDTPRRRLPFWNHLFSTHFPRGQFGSSLRMPMRTHRQRGIGDPILRSNAPPHPGPLGLCHTPASRPLLSSWLNFPRDLPAGIKPTGAS